MSISAFLRAHDLFLRKDLGQHFLTDETVLRKIVETADIKPQDHIVEIGPGIGILTKELVQRAAKVTAIELDQRLIPLLQEYLGCLDASASLNTSSPSHVIPSVPMLSLSKQRDVSRDMTRLGTRHDTISSRLSIIHGDALKIPFPNEPYKVVANIPYHITSPLLRHAFRESKVHPTTMTLLIQREVAEKIVAKEDFGLLTILVGLFGKPKIVKIVPPGAFLPPPNVDSALLHIECFPEPLASPEALDEVFRITKIAFGQKRKMLRNTVGGLERGMERLEEAGIDPTRRPQTLGIQEWIRLAKIQA